MKKEDYIFYSIFMMFSGFMIFIFTILNKRFMFLELLSTYFILFLFSGVLITVLGLIFMFVWHVETRMPYEVVVKVKTHYPPYLAFGLLLILIGFTVIFYYSTLSKMIYIMSMSIAIVGILVLVRGLIYYYQEVISTNRVTQKKPVHS